MFGEEIEAPPTEEGYASRISVTRSEHKAKRERSKVKPERCSRFRTAQPQSKSPRKLTPGRADSPVSPEKTKSEHLKQKEVEKFSKSMEKIFFQAEKLRKGKIELDREEKKKADERKKRKQEKQKRVKEKKQRMKEISSFLLKQKKED